MGKTTRDVMEGRGPFVRHADMQIPTTARAPQDTMQRVYHFVGSWTLIGNRSWKALLSRGEDGGS